MILLMHNQKSSTKPSSTVDANIFIARKLLLIQKSLTKLESLPTQKSSTKPSFKADAQIFSAYRQFPDSETVDEVTTT